MSVDLSVNFGKTNAENLQRSYAASDPGFDCSTLQNSTGADSSSRLGLLEMNYPRSLGIASRFALERAHSLQASEGAREIRHHKRGFAQISAVPCELPTESCESNSFEKTNMAMAKEGRVSTSQGESTSRRRLCPDGEKENRKGAAKPHCPWEDGGWNRLELAIQRTDELVGKSIELFSKRAAVDAPSTPENGKLAPQLERICSQLHEVKSQLDDLQVTTPRKYPSRTR